MFRIDKNMGLWNNWRWQICPLHHFTILDLSCVTVQANYKSIFPLTCVHMTSYCIQCKPWEPKFLSSYSRSFDRWWVSAPYTGYSADLSVTFRPSWNRSRTIRVFFPFLLLQHSLVFPTPKRCSREPRAKLIFSILQRRHSAWISMRWSRASEEGPRWGAREQRAERERDESFCRSRCEVSINPSRREGGGGGVEKSPTHDVEPILKNMRHFPKKVKRLLGRDFSHPFLKSRSPAQRWHPVCCRIRAGVCAGPQSPVVAPALQGTGVGVWVCGCGCGMSWSVWKGKTTHTD